MRLPEILVLSDSFEFLSKTARDEGGERKSLKIMACEEGGRQNVLSLWRSFPMNKQVLAVVGPEGGWDRGEMDRFMETGFHPVHLGPRVLRLETAAIGLVAVVQLLWGDFGE
jgi:16S rRNA (uracil1498-N3)-methyltransferase